MHERLDFYMKMLEDLEGGRISAADFQLKYLKAFKNDTTDWSEEEFEILNNEVFWAAEAFCGDPDLRDEDDIDEQQMRDVCNNALERIKKIS